MEADIARLQNAPVKVESISSTVQVQVPVAVRKDPAEILQRLASLRPGQGAQRRRTIRQIVHELESLVELGPESLPVIQAFLAQNQDVEYSPTRSEEATPDAEGGAERERRRRRGRTSRARTFGRRKCAPGRRSGRGAPNHGSSSPFRLRFGSDSSTPCATLGARTLNGPCGGAGHDGARCRGCLLDDAARGAGARTISRGRADLGAQSVGESTGQIADPSRLDEEAKSYLYSGSSSATRTLPLRPPRPPRCSWARDRRIHSWALSYLAETLKDQAMPAIYQAYNRYPRHEPGGKGAVGEPGLASSGQESARRLHGQECDQQRGPAGRDARHRGPGPGDRRRGRRRSW